jgi:hypothetical protein
VLDFAIQVLQHACDALGWVELVFVFPEKGRKLFNALLIRQVEQKVGQKLLSVLLFIVVKKPRRNDGLQGVYAFWKIDCFAPQKQENVLNGSRDQLSSWCLTDFKFRGKSIRVHENASETIDAVERCQCRISVSPNPKTQLALLFGSK